MAMFMTLVGTEVWMDSLNRRSCSPEDESQSGFCHQQVKGFSQPVKDPDIHEVVGTNIHGSQMMYPNNFGDLAPPCG